MVRDGAPGPAPASAGHVAAGAIDDTVDRSYTQIGAPANFLKNGGNKLRDMLQWSSDPYPKSLTVNCTEDPRGQVHQTLEVLLEPRWRCRRELSLPSTLLAKLPMTLLHLEGTGVDL